MAPVQLQYGVLIDEMKTFDTTNGWDVVVSYNEEKINSLLKTVKGHGPTQFPDMVAEVYDPVTDEMVETAYRLKVSNPVLQFRSERGNVELQYDLAGDFGPKPTPGGDSGFKPHPDQLHPDIGERYKQGPNYVVNVGGEETARGICLVFRDTLVQVTNPSTDPKVQAIINRLRADITTATADHLNKSTYYYFIAGVGIPHRLTRDSTTVTLQPRSFCFTLLVGDSQLKHPGTLVMWIGVEGGNHNGQQPGGATSLTFHPDSRDVKPSSAAEHCQFDDVEILSRKSDGKSNGLTLIGNSLTNRSIEGMKFSGKMRNQRIYIPTRNDRTGNAFAFTLDYFQGVDFSPNTSNTIIDVPARINPSNPRLSPITVSYKSDVRKVNWTQQRYNGEIHSVKSGVVKLEFVLAGIRLNFRRDNDLTVNASAEKPPWWAPAGSGQLPSHYEKLTMTLDLDIAMGNLDYFLTTNLLFPGKHIFIADPPTPNINYDHGLAVPRDLILTGQVTDKLRKTQQGPPLSRTSIL
ncbi:hypothetical protein BDW59DRAFT_166898 [Aspergillus cavernicola]|uniref:Uncharacterized protein n=1 Tax=Aspergillus cavernicola TaxID=176166 RepID=A0ABR4HIC3_9EURO